MNGEHDDDNSRVTELHEVVEALFADHDDGQLDAELWQTTGRVADVTFELKEFGFARLVVARVVVKAALGEGNKVNFQMIEKHLRMKLTFRVTKFYCMYCAALSEFASGNIIAKEFMSATRMLT